MTAAAFFALYAGAAGVLAPRALRGGWVTRSPRLAITVWLALSASWLTAVVMAVLAAAAPIPLAWAAAGPGGRVLAGPPVPGGGIIAFGGLALAAAVVVRAGWCLVREVNSGRRGRREHAAVVAAAGRPGPDRDVVIIEHEAPSVYCVASGRYRIVAYSGALAALNEGQIRAVIAHERAHLRCRHHAMLILTSGLARAFPRVPLLTQAQGQVGVLAEMAADDAAVRGHRHDELAAALVILAGADPGAAALTAGGTAAMIRLERLLAPPERHRPQTAWLAAVAGLMPPAAVACIPLAIAACDLITYRA